MNSAYFPYTHPRPPLTVYYFHFLIILFQSEKKLMGGDGHDLKQHGKRQILGGDGHDMQSHGTPEHLLGGKEGLTPEWVEDAASKKMLGGKEGLTPKWVEDAAPKNLLGGKEGLTPKWVEDAASKQMLGGKEGLTPQWVEDAAPKNLFGDALLLQGVPIHNTVLGGGDHDYQKHKDGKKLGLLGQGKVSYISI